MPREIFLWCFQKPTKTAELALAWVTRSGSKKRLPVLSEESAQSNHQYSPAPNRSRQILRGLLRMQWQIVCGKHYTIDGKKQENDEKYDPKRNKQIGIGHFGVNTTRQTEYLDLPTLLTNTKKGLVMRKWTSTRTCMCYFSGFEQPGSVYLGR